MRRSLKAALIMGIILMFGTVLIPLNCLTSSEMNAVQTAAGVKIKAKSEDLKEGYFTVFLKKQNKTEKISVSDYLFGAVGSEMPLTFGDEALKAQTVAAYTFAKRKQEAAAKSGAKYDITDDYTIDQAYTDKSELIKKWGESSAENEKLLNSVINAVKGEYLSFDNKIAFTPYFAISSGQTDNCKDVFGGNLSYLESVDSSFDKLAAGYHTAVTFTSSELKEKLKGKADTADESKNCFSDIERLGSKRVKSLNVSDKKLTGSELQKLLGLRSACFDISFKDGIYTFDVYGYGHNVGMSQTGASYMAAQGSGYKEILSHYYKGCEIKS